jgi:cobalamin biosynthesis protein CbiD
MNYFHRKHDEIMFIWGRGEGEVAASLALSATTKDFEPELLTAPETNSTKISWSGVPGWLVKLLNGIFQVEVQHVGMCNVKSVQHNWTITLANGLFI